MRDGQVVADLSLPLADRAVKYLLDRAQRDADLRHYLIHTQAHALLVAAEAARTGQAADDVEEYRLRWLGDASVPDIVRCRRLLDEHGIDY